MIRGVIVARVATAVIRSRWCQHRATGSAAERESQTLDEWVEEAQRVCRHDSSDAKRVAADKLVRQVLSLLQQAEASLVPASVSTIFDVLSVARELPHQSTPTVFRFAVSCLCGSRGAEVNDRSADEGSRLLSTCAATAQHHHHRAVSSEELEMALRIALGRQVRIRKRSSSIAASVAGQSLADEELPLMTMASIDGTNNVDPLVRAFIDDSDISQLCDAILILTPPLRRLQKRLELLRLLAEAKRPGLAAVKLARDGGVAEVERMSAEELGRWFISVSRLRLWSRLWSYPTEESFPASVDVMSMQPSAADPCRKFCTSVWTTFRSADEHSKATLFRGIAVVARHADPASEPFVPTLSLLMEMQRSLSQGMVDDEVSAAECDTINAALKEVANTITAAVEPGCGVPLWAKELARESLTFAIRIVERALGENANVTLPVLPRVAAAHCAFLSGGLLSLSNLVLARNACRGVESTSDVAVGCDVDVQNVVLRAAEQLERLIGATNAGGRVASLMHTEVHRCISMLRVLFAFDILPSTQLVANILRLVERSVEDLPVDVLVDALDVVSVFGVPGAPWNHVAMLRVLREVKPLLPATRSVLDRFIHQYGGGKHHEARRYGAGRKRRYGNGWS